MTNTHSTQGNDMLHADFDTQIQAEETREYSDYVAAEELTAIEAEDDDDHYFYDGDLYGSNRFESDAYADDECQYDLDRDLAFYSS